MKFHPDFERFLQTWKEKADSYGTESLVDIYDKFFTLFVIHNRLYAMATFCLWSEGEEKPPTESSFPDTNSATKYLAHFLGASKLMRAIFADKETKIAFETLTELLHVPPHLPRFYFKLKLPFANPDKKADEKLHRDLRSDEDCKRATALLEILHCVRCNMFHGSKNYEVVQKDVLLPTIVILKKVILLTHEELKIRDEPSVQPLPG